MRRLHGLWKQMDPRQKEPFERAAAADANRYRREVYTYNYFYNNVRTVI